MSTPATSPSSKQLWVVGFDGSDHAQRALDWAAAVADPERVGILVVSAWQYPYFGGLGMAGNAIPAMGADMEVEIVNAVTAAGDAVAEKSGVEVEARAMLGPAAQVLLEAAEEADLIVVGNRGRGGFARLLLGSVSHQMAVHAACPSIIVPPHAAGTTEIQKVVVGVDGSVGAMQALRWASTFAPASATITAVHAWSFPTAAYGYVSDAERAEQRGATEAVFNAGIDELEQELAATPGAERTFVRHFEEGLAGEILTKAGADAQLLVVGARSHHGIAAAVLGSVANVVSHSLPCSTAVVPPTAEAETPVADETGAESP
ncbi:MAG: universal stress protein [Acidimicrobiales bacterium]|nr:universal stress protein [Acidimicrobiales bacterium]